MNRIKKWDLFLLERFPLLWHTKICYMLLYSITLSAIFYGWGFFYTNQFHINNRSIGSYFSDSYASLFLVIFFLIGSTFWALAYFRKNAVKNFYPLQRFYFTRLFLSFILIFWSLTWPWFTFNWGVQQKVRTLVSIDELKQEIKTINTANAFLPENSSDYEAEYYLKAKIPNLEWMTYNWRDSSWNTDGFSLRQGTIDSLSDYIPAENPDASNQVDGMIFQLLKYKKINTGSRCNPAYYEVVTQKLRYKDLTNHRVFDLRNYGEEVINPDYFNFPEYTLFQSYREQIHPHHSYYYESGLDLEYEVNFHYLNLKVNRDVNELLDQKSPVEIAQVVKRYQRLLKKYAIDHYLEADTILNYLAGNPDAIKKQAIAAKEIWDLREIREARAPFPSFAAYQQNRDTTKNLSEYPPAYFVDQSQVKELYENVYEASFPYMNWSNLLISVFIAILLSLVFVLFSFGDLLTLLLAIPFGGILIVLNVLCAVFLTSFGIHENFDTKISIQIPLFMLLMYGLLFWFYHSKKVHKRILNMTFYLCFVMTVLFPFALMFLIDNLFQKELVSDCGREYTRHTVFFYWMSDPLLGILLPTITILLFMKWIKPIHSKAD